MPENNADNSTGTPRPLGGRPDFRKYEQRYLEWGKAHPESIYAAAPDSIDGGFNRPPPDRDSNPPDERPPARPHGQNPPPPEMMKTMQEMQTGMRRAWEDIEPYYDNPEIQPFEPKPNLWEDLLKFVADNWDDVNIGFTELPRQMIFRDKFTLFKYALVVSQEMKKDKINLAPGTEAGQEVMRVYSSLGLVVNDIARWLRQQGERCQSNHPMGGLVNTPSLGGKAGMGWQGRSGILITPQYGPRVRLAPVFIEHQVFDFTDNRNHDWIEKHCAGCGICARECPGQAIYSEKRINIDGVPGIGALRTCIDRGKCMGPFSQTQGCSVCIKVCPFSQGDGTYARLKTAVENKTG